MTLKSPEWRMRQCHTVPPLLAGCLAAFALCAVRTVMAIALLLYALSGIATSNDDHGFDELFPIRPARPVDEQFVDGSTLKRLETGELLFVGEISEVAGRRITEEIRTRPAPVWLTIESHKGEYLPALQVAWAVASQRLVVRTGRVCTFPCIWVLANARLATVSVATLLVIERLKTADGDPLRDHEADIEVLEPLFAENGIDPAILRPLRTSTRWVLTVREAIDSGLVDMVINPSTGNAEPGEDFCHREPRTCDYRPAFLRTYP